MSDLCCLQPVKQIGEKPVLWLLAGQLQDCAPGMPGYPPAHIHDTVHDGFHAPTRGFLQPPRPADYHILADDLEHIVHQHSHFEKSTVHGELSGWQALHVQFALEFGMILFTGSSVPVCLQNMPLIGFQIRQRGENDHFRGGRQAKAGCQCCGSP